MPDCVSRKRIARSRVGLGKQYRPVPGPVEAEGRHPFQTQRSGRSSCPYKLGFQGSSQPASPPLWSALKSSNSQYWFSLYQNARGVLVSTESKRRRRNAQVVLQRTLQVKQAHRPAVALCLSMEIGVASLGLTNSLSLCASMQQLDFRVDFSSQPNGKLSAAKYPKAGPRGAKALQAVLNRKKIYRKSVPRHGRNLNKGCSPVEACNCFLR